MKRDEVARTNVRISCEQIDSFKQTGCEYEKEEKKFFGSNHHRKKLNFAEKRKSLEIDR